MRGAASSRTHRLDGLRVIALFKMLKALLFLATSFGVYQLLNPVLVERLRYWVNSLTDSFERRLLISGLNWIDSLGGARIGGILVVTTLYTALLMTEGVGLWLRRTWAEWLTVVATASFVPFELWRLFASKTHHHLAVVSALILNIAIVVYLVWQIRRSRKRR